MRKQYEEDRFHSLSAIDRLEVMEDLVETGRELHLRFDPDWRDPLDDCALDVATLQLCLGHLDRARKTAEEVLHNVSDDSERGQRALATLCEAAHASESPDKEEQLLDRWWNIPEERRSGDAFLRHARRDIRVGRGDRALRTLDALLNRSGHDAPERLLFELERARALSYSDHAEDAPDAIAAVEAAAGPSLDDPEFAVRLAHAAYIADHNLDRNDDAVRRAKTCMERYKQAGLREGYLLSKINLGDARWGTRADDRPWAIRTLRSVRDETAGAAFAHPRALAAICLANVIATDDPIGARELYDFGIKESGWTYDQLYGRIYRALLDAERDGRDGAALRELSTTASSAFLGYLADIAAGYAAMRDVEHGVEPHGAREVLERAGAAPLARAYAAASIIAGPGEGKADVKDILFRTLRPVQGLKGRPRFVARVALSAATTDAERTVAHELAVRFPPTDAMPTVP